MPSHAGHFCICPPANQRDTTINQPRAWLTYYLGISLTAEEVATAGQLKPLTQGQGYRARALD